MASPPSRSPRGSPTSWVANGEPASLAFVRLGLTRQTRAIAIGDIILIAGALGQTFVTTSGGYIGTRLIIGFGGVIAAVAAPSLATELSHPRQFGRVAGYVSRNMLCSETQYSSSDTSTTAAVCNRSVELPKAFTDDPSPPDYAGAILAVILTLP